MIDKFETLYPEYFDSFNLYYKDEPYAYWLSVPEYNIYEWVLYKEYNDYKSAVGNGGLQGMSYEQLIDSFKTYSFYEGIDREMLCRTFRQRSLDDNPYDFDDFVKDEL